MLYLGVSETHEVQLKIMEALTRKFRLHPNLDLRSIANACPFNYTGADFYALCSDAMLNAMSRTAQRIGDQLSKKEYFYKYSFQSHIYTSSEAQSRTNRSNASLPPYPSVLFDGNCSSQRNPGGGISRRLFASFTESCPECQPSRDGALCAGTKTILAECR